ncbi:MAG: hypothetical protein KDA89_08170 [Planctomycetaceae bacterium]|nr:hypothetical protein [Planctomycetaceae bacterium]
MKVEDCIVAVERRTVGGCIDLAFVFASRFALPVIRITLWFAVPCLLLVWLVGDSLRHDVFLPGMLIFAFFTMLAGGALIAAVGPQVFGVPMNSSAAMRALLKRLIPYVVLGTLVRLTGVCLFVPVIFFLAWAGFLPEVIFLELTGFNQISQRLSWLSRGGGYSRSLGRLITISVFWMLISAGLFLAVDLIATWVFNAPIFFGTIAPGPDQWKAFTSRLIDDPRLILTLQAVLWVTWPVMRIAWFFCYLDQRIRAECWDLDLQFRTEARRIELLDSGAVQTAG